MIEFLRSGGYGAVAVLLVGLFLLATSAWFAVRKDGRVRGFLEALGRALVFFSLTGTVTGFAQTLRYAAERAPAGEERAVALLLGLGESLGSLILGFAFLGLSWLLIAVGQRRIDARSELG